MRGGSDVSVASSQARPIEVLRVSPLSAEDVRDIGRPPNFFLCAGALTAFASTKVSVATAPSDLWGRFFFSVWARPSSNG